MSMEKKWKEIFMWPRNQKWKDVDVKAPKGDIDEKSVTFLDGEKAKVKLMLTMMEKPRNQNWKKELIWALMLMQKQQKEILM